MEYMIITLFSLSILLFIISFFRQDQSKRAERLIENYSITLMQEIYQLKKKIKVLEEEILIGEDERYFTTNTSPIIYDRDKILALCEEGHSLDEIAELTSFSQQKVNDILGG